MKNAEKPPVPKPVVSKQDDSPKALSSNTITKEDSPKKAKTDGNKKSSHKRKASNKCVDFLKIFVSAKSKKRILINYP